MLEKSILQETMVLMRASSSRWSSSHQSRGESSVRVPATSGPGSVASRVLMPPPAPVLVVTPVPAATPAVVVDPSAVVEGGAPAIAPLSVAEPVAEPSSVPDPAAPPANVA